MKYLDITIVLERCGIEPALAVLDTMGIDDAEVRDPRDAEEIMADKETYEWDYVDQTLLDEHMGKRAGREPVLTAWLEDTDENREKGIGAFRSGGTGVLLLPFRHRRGPGGQLLSTAPGHEQVGRNPVQFKRQPCL